MRWNRPGPMRVLSVPTQQRPPGSETQRPPRGRFGSIPGSALNAPGDTRFSSTSLAIREDLGAPDHLGNAHFGTKVCTGGVGRRGVGLPITLANPHVLSVSIDPESGS